MTIKKTVTEKVIAANRANAQDSTGPEDCTHAKGNARKHGYRSKQLFFPNAEEENQYNALLEELDGYYQPEGPIGGNADRRNRTVPVEFRRLAGLGSAGN